MIDVTQAYIDADVNGQKPERLVFIDFAGLPVYLTTASVHVPWNDELWLSGGLLLESGALDLVDEVRTLSESIVITGVDQNIKATILNHPSRQKMREVQIYEAYLDNNGQVLPTPVLADTLFIDSVSMVAGTVTDTVAIQLAGEFADFDFKNGIRTTQGSIQRYHQDDKIFEFSKAAGKPVKWGGR